MQQPAEPEPQLIDLREFLGVLRRRKWTVILTAFAVMFLALGLVLRRAPVYTSSARVEVRALTAGGDQYGYYYDLQSAMDTEAERVSSSLIADEAYKLGASAGSLAEATVPSNTTFLDITCTEAAPESAQACADSFARAYVNGRLDLANASYRAMADPYVRALNEATTDQERIAASLQLAAIPKASPTAAILVSPAEVPLAPANKGYITTGVLAMIVGLALGIGLAFVRERLDERVAGREDMEEALGAPVLAVVPKVPGWRNKNDTRLVTLTAPTSAASEAYRTARTTLLYLSKEGGMRAIAVTGPGQGEGKTTTVVNLAVSLAQSGKRVIAVSCDLRRPRMHRFLDIANTTGLSDVLTGRADVKDALLKTSVPGLVVVPSGHVPQNPAELLASPLMDDLLTQFRRLADIVLLDTPPSLVVADALEVAPKADGVLVVADAGTTHRSALLHLTSQIERVGGTVIGAILNNFDASSAKHYEPYGKYYGGGDKYQPRDSAEAPTSNGSSNGHANGAEPEKPRGRSRRRSKAEKQAPSSGAQW